MQDDRQRERKLFEEALALSPQQRTDFLSRACQGDDRLRARLEDLLRAFAEAPGVVEEEEITLEAAEPLTEREGSVIGRYKLLQQIGEGGFGVVYMAEQTEPVVRRVALKIIKLGMDTRQVVARFEAERQALALMDHPNIAKVFDAGSTETGRPYFVMELVKGIPITEFCDKNRLSAGQRLELFLPVCEAIQHAHQKGIIHRDIKPSNILVTLHDGEPLPMVIDFGIAKATNQRLTEKTLFTDFAQMIGTPAYMSPEQAEMSKLDVDTRTDIYSLGVLLYELLTGTTPFSSRELLQGGYGAMQRIIAEQEPPRPSTRLGTMGAEQKTTVLRNRGNDLSDLGARLRGDLDWIVMKCLEKERARRYETANALAADLQRHLHSEAVLARPPSASYRLRKAVRRNRLAFGAAGAVVLALVLGLAAASWQAVRAGHEARRAQQAEALARQRLAESEAVSKFMTEVFQSPDPARDGRTITVAETLAAAAKRVETDLADQAAVRAHLQATLASTYASLGFWAEAIPLQEVVVDYHRLHSGPEHPETLRAMHRLAVYSERVGSRQSGVRELAEEVLRLCQKVLGPEHPDTLSAMHNLASVTFVGDHDKALKLQVEVLRLRRKVLGPEHPDTLSTMHDLAISYGWTAGGQEKSLRLREEVMRLRRKVLGPEHPDNVEAMTSLAYAYKDAGRAAEAVRLAEEGLILSRRVLGPEHSETIGALTTFADCSEAAGRPNEARTLWDEALKLQTELLERRRTMLGPEHPDTLRAIQTLADYHSSSFPYEERRWDKTMTLYEELLALRRKLLGTEHPDTLYAMTMLADHYKAFGRNEAELPLREELLAIRRTIEGVEAPSTIGAMHSVARVYATLGRQNEAIKLKEQAV